MQPEYVFSVFFLPADFGDFADILENLSIESAKSPKSAGENT